MNETEEKIHSWLRDLRTHQSRLRTESVKVGEAISALERLLENSSCTASGVSVVGVRHAQSRAAGARVALAFPPQTFAGLSQRRAAIELLRKVGQPMAMLDILETLERSGYGFRAKSPYHSLFAAMSRAPEIVKRGNTWDLSERAANPGEPPGAVESPEAHTAVSAGEAPAGDNRGFAAKSEVSGAW